MNALSEVFHLLDKKYVFTLCKRYAGHSKWANIRHTKSANDTARSKLFMKFAQRIKISIQVKGDANPETNTSLASAIEVAKKNSMPVSSIQNAIKVAQGAKVKSEECWFEIKGPKGCFIIAMAITDNRKKTRDGLATILRKNNVTFADNILRVLFERKAVIEAKPPDGVTDIDQVTDHAIESGVEEVSPSEVDTYLFYCESRSLESVKNQLEKLNYNVIEADDHFIPTSRVNLSDAELEAMGKLCDKLEEHPDVVKLYDNIA